MVVGRHVLVCQGSWWGCASAYSGGLSGLSVMQLPSFSLKRYDPRHNRWFQIQSLQQEHADLCVCVVGRYIYAVAGRDYHNDLNAVERYDPATNSWAYVAPLKREVRKPLQGGPFPARFPSGVCREWMVKPGNRA